MVKVLVVRQALVGVISGVAVAAGGLVLGSSGGAGEGEWRWGVLDAELQPDPAS